MNKVNGWLEISVGHWVGFGYCPISDWVQFLPSNQIGSGLIQTIGSDCITYWNKLKKYIKSIIISWILYENCQKTPNPNATQSEIPSEFEISSKSELIRTNPNPNSSEVFIRSVLFRFGSDRIWGLVGFGCFFFFPNPNNLKSDQIHPNPRFYNPTWNEKRKLKGMWIHLFSVLIAEEIISYFYGTGSDCFQLLECSNGLGYKSEWKEKSEFPY